MAIFLGVILVVVTWLLNWGLGAVLGFNLYWLTAGGWALWAALDAKKSGMARYQRVFPLEPIGLFLAVLLILPLALPWYIRLKDQALLGRLTPSTGRSLARVLVIAAAALAPFAWYSLGRALGNTSLVRRLVRIEQAVGAATSEHVKLNLDVDGTLDIKIVNSSIAKDDGLVRQRHAHDLAIAAMQAEDTTSTIREVTVEFVSLNRSDEATIDDQFQWHAWQLR